jgi:predicted house-cleaning NTP pyrophosphatase (Maf/HAM1 superfamily)
MEMVLTLQSFRDLGEYETEYFSKPGQEEELRKFRKALSENTREVGSGHKHNIYILKKWLQYAADIASAYVDLLKKNKVDEYIREFASRGLFYR